MSEGGRRHALGTPRCSCCHRRRAGMRLSPCHHHSLGLHQHKRVVVTEDGGRRKIGEELRVMASTSPWPTQSSVGEVARRCTPVRRRGMWGSVSAAMDLVFVQVTGPRSEQVEVAATMVPPSPREGHLFMKYGLHAADVTMPASASCTLAMRWCWPRPAHEIFCGGRV
jgi:hypothetical protein